MDRGRRTRRIGRLRWRPHHRARHTRRARIIELKPPNKIAVLSNRQIRCARSPTIERPFRRQPVANRRTRVAHVGGSRASALLSVAPCLPLVEYVGPVGTPGRLRGIPEQRSPRAMEGESAPAIDVGAQLQRRAHQRGAEMTRSRAGSPTRATRHTASLQGMLHADPALP